MNLNFPLILVTAAFITGIVALFDKLFFARNRIATNTKRPIAIDYCYSLFPILLIVLVIRSFGYEAWRIPSGSLEPTLLPGDLILVNKFDYGLRLPVVDKKIVAISEPKTGDIVIFPSKIHPFLIKRVIGIPGDHISYINKVLYVNGHQASQQFLGNTTDTDGNGNKWPVKQLQENLLGIKHNIYVNPALASDNFTNIIVPPGKYFVMGDNRDDSLDSRYWGFVPEKTLVGKAVLVLFSWDHENMHFRLSRFGKKIYLQT